MKCDELDLLNTTDFWFHFVLSFGKSECQSHSEADGRFLYDLIVVRYCHCLNVVEPHCRANGYR